MIQIVALLIQVFVWVFVGEEYGRVAGDSRVCAGRKETKESMQMTFGELGKTEMTAFCC